MRTSTRMAGPDRDVAPPGVARRRRMGLATGAAAVAPWTWFWWRDAVGPVDGLRTLVVTTQGVLAIFLPVLVGAAVVLAIGLGLWRRQASLGLVAASVLAFGVVAVAGPWRPMGGPAPVDAVRVVVVNPRVSNDDPAAARDVLAQAGDVVVVAEGGPVADDLAAAYPHTITAHETGGRGAVRVLSRFPLQRADERATLLAAGVFRFVVDGPDGRFVLYAAHPDPPGLGTGFLSPVEQERLFARLGGAVTAEALPVVVAGDLNLVDRSASFRRLTGDLVDATADHWRGPTSLRWRPLLARIDHILVSPGWCTGAATTYSISGSDHRGVAADVGRCPDGV